MANRNLKWFKRGLDSALSVGKSIIPPAVNFLVAYIVIQLADQKTWGQFVEVLIFTSLCSMFVSFGIKGGFIGSMISNWAMLIAYVVVFRKKLKSSENV
jgi:hypothetical protein